ncbi:MAG: type II toxin-antitoxin system prevent-host-death family antitoxin [Candidatus Acidiferrales bacterium]
MAASKGRILVVDDQAEVRGAYSRYLAKEGFEVTEASDGAEALNRVEDGQFDLVLTDLVMPTMNGMKLLCELKEAFPDLPVVVMLETADNRAMLSAAESGALQTLVKPIDQGLLVELANHAVGLHRSRARKVASFRDRRGQRAEAARVSATEAKNEFGRVLESVLRGEFVVITKHADPKAVLMSVDEFNALSYAPTTVLDTLSDEFDALLARLQTPKARRGLKAAFDAAPEDLGRAALAGARHRG